MRSQSLPNYKCRRAKTAVAKSFVLCWMKRFCQQQKQLLIYSDLRSYWIWEFVLN